MKFSFIEKLGASLLICAWLIYGANFIGNQLVHVEQSTAVAAVHGEEPETEAKTEALEEELDLSALLGAADPAAGEKVFGKCKACHTVEQGGKNKVGPNLWNVVGRSKASVDGFSYSTALSDHGGEWSYDDLNAFLTSPKDYAPGTKMTYAGLKKATDRAAVIKYLREQSDSPKPLP